MPFKWEFRWWPDSGVRLHTGCMGILKQHAYRNQRKKTDFVACKHLTKSSLIRPLAIDSLESMITAKLSTGLQFASLSSWAGQIVCCLVTNPEDMFLTPRPIIYILVTLPLSQ